MQLCYFAHSGTSNFDFDGHDNFTTYPSPDSTPPDYFNNLSFEIQMSFSFKSLFLFFGTGQTAITNFFLAIMNS